MKKQLITNFDKFKKRNLFCFLTPNCEIILYGGNTNHYQLKNDQVDGIKIEWKGNPFLLGPLVELYILNK